MKSTQSLAEQSRPPLIADWSAGLVVFLVAIPLCLGVALASNAPLVHLFRALHPGAVVAVSIVILLVWDKTKRTSLVHGLLLLLCVALLPAWLNSSRSLGACTTCARESSIFLSRPDAFLTAGFFRKGTPPCNLAKS